MRLLNVHTLLFREFHDGRDIPPYIIASHRWGDDEATYKCVLKKKARSVVRDGYRKVEAFCEFIRDSACGVEWLWIDTCCIDKDSSAELQESINSMFRWYRRARCCLAFLGDVGGEEGFRGSVWFTRAWTLQELLAPAKVLFVDRDWERIGYKGRVRKDMKVFVGSENDLTSVIHEITGIPESVLYDYGASRELSFKEKQNWVLGRETTREEDKAYCLLGIFDVSMPLVYGEKRKAHKRLLKEIQEKRRERDAKRERKLHKKRKERWRKEKVMDSGPFLQPIPEDEHPPPHACIQSQSETLVLLPPASSEYEDASTKEHRHVAIVSSLRKRWHDKGSRDEAIHSLVAHLERCGYPDPGASIHNALDHAQSRSRLAQAAYLDMMQLGWVHERAVEFMVRVLQADGHCAPIARAIVMEYLMFNAAAIDVFSFPYIPAKPTPEAESGADDGRERVDEEDKATYEAERNESGTIRTPRAGLVLENGDAITGVTETKLSGLGVSRQGGPKIAHEPASSFDMFIQTHIFC